MKLFGTLGVILLFCASANADSNVTSNLTYVPCEQGWAMRAARTYCKIRERTASNQTIRTNHTVHARAMIFLVWTPQVYMAAGSTQRSLSALLVQKLALAALVLGRIKVISFAWLPFVLYLFVRAVRDTMSSYRKENE